ncbi:MAG: PP2C family protein-serine/threonine phosphatase, partial [Bacteroidota bacterium]
FNRQHVKELKMSDEIKQKNEDLTDSIVYARRIQRSILPLKTNVFQSFEDAFVYYRPKDIVSGDFYWHSERDGIHYLAAVDCTGHGVPGAFMSMLGASLLKQIVETEGYLQPGKILEQLHLQVRAALKQGGDGEKTEDGMDLSLIAWHPTEKRIEFAGAYNSLVYFHKKDDGTYEEEVFKADRQPIGGSSDERRVFTQYDIQGKPGDVLYMYSDGYPDQFGGERGKKFMDKRLRRELMSMAHEPMDQQEARLDRMIKDWRGDREQLDDVLVIGFRIS